MPESSHPVAVVPSDTVALAGLRRTLAELGPTWPCLRVEELGVLVSERRIRIVVTAPRDSRGTLIAGAVSSLARQAPGVRIVLLYPPTVPGLADARAVAETGACVAHLLEPAGHLARTLGSVLSPRWRRGPEHLLVRGLIPPLAGAAEPIGTLSVLRPWAPARIGDRCALLGLHQRRVERDFARSFPRSGLARPLTAQRFGRLSLALSIAWWLANGRPADQLVGQFGFIHRYALAEHLKHYAGRPPGGFARPRDFREAYSAVLRSLLSI